MRSQKVDFFYCITRYEEEYFSGHSVVSVHVGSKGAIWMTVLTNSSCEVSERTGLLSFFSVMWQTPSLLSFVCMFL